MNSRSCVVVCLQLIVILVYAAPPIVGRLAVIHKHADSGSSQALTRVIRNLTSDNESERTASLGTVLHSPAQVQSDKAQSLKQAVIDLASNDETERKAAQTTVLGLGELAIPSLVDLLRSVTPDVELCPPGSNLPCRTGYIVVSNEETRLRSDVLSLLGHLHAADAVPLMIRLLGLWESSGAGLRYWGPERDALVEIGSPAVPELIRSLMLAENRRRTVRLVNGSLAPYLSIQERIVDVLGRIGDERALACFRKLKESNTSSVLLDDLDEAEERIKQKALKK